MKKILIALCLLSQANFIAIPEKENIETQTFLHQFEPVAENIFIITTDGLRWQEVFTGADSCILSDTNFTSDIELNQLLFWDAQPEERRKKLMPFFWNVLEKKGQLLGNRFYNNQVNVKNIYGFSYPGYNELLTGNTDFFVNTNKKVWNSNTTILEKLNQLPEYKNKIAAVTSWDVFPYILNEQRSKLPVNSGYDNIASANLSETEKLTNTIQQKVIEEKAGTRYDMLTFLTAKEYIKKNQPKVMFISFGETDEWAHKGHYDLYLQHAKEFDNYLAELWYFVQTNEHYKNKTTFIITTDHGRGYKNKSSWKRHGAFTPGSKNIWLALLGAGIEPKGEAKDDIQFYQKDVTKIILRLLGVQENDFILPNAVYTNPTNQTQNQVAASKSNQ